ncbi:hypothetical protein AB0E27_24755 [Streptomyces sparsogenes]|uniref:hypothetical protein n=1 Tax=Streptomyces sparsogenes TaxID=67365 RepID=UPI0033FA4AF1
MTDQPTTKTDRWARREPLLHLLGRLDRGTLLESERRLLRAAVDAELADAEAAHAALVEVLGIVTAWCVEANETGGVDATDLAWRLEQAGHPLPDEETAAPAEDGDSR